MAVTWTDSTRGKTRIKSGTSMTSSEIDDLIEQNEGLIIDRMKIPSSFIFDAAKKEHLILRKAVEAMTVLLVIASTPMSFQTLESAYMAANITKDELDI